MWTRYFIFLLGTVLYRNYMVPYRQGSATNEIPNHWVSPSLQSLIEAFVRSLSKNGLMFEFSELASESDSVQESEDLNLKAWVCFGKSRLSKNQLKNYDSSYKICSISYGKYDMVDRIRPPQDVDVLATLDFQIPCSRPDTSGFYLRCLWIKYEGHGRKLGCLRWGRKRATQRSRTARTSTSRGALDWIWT